jgi:hypothetical protein
MLSIKSKKYGMKPTNIAGTDPWVMDCKVLAGIFQVKDSIQNTVFS